MCDWKSSRQLPFPKKISKVKMPQAQNKSSKQSEELFQPDRLTADDLIETPLPDLFAPAEVGGLSNAQKSLVYFTANDIVQQQLVQLDRNHRRQRLVQNLLEFALALERSKLPFGFSDSKQEVQSDLALTSVNQIWGLNFDSLQLS